MNFEGFWILYIWLTATALTTTVSSTGRDCLKRSSTCTEFRSCCRKVCGPNRVMSIMGCPEGAWWSKIIKGCVCDGMIQGEDGNLIAATRLSHREQELLCLNPDVEDGNCHANFDAQLYKYSVDHNCMQKTRVSLETFDRARSAYCELYPKRCQKNSMICCHIAGSDCLELYRKVDWDVVTDPPEPEPPAEKILRCLDPTLKNGTCHPNSDWKEFTKLSEQCSGPKLTEAQVMATRDAYCEKYPKKCHQASWLCSNYSTE